MPSWLVGGRFIQKDGGDSSSEFENLHPSNLVEFWMGINNQESQQSKNDFAPIVLHSIGVILFVHLFVEEVYWIEVEFVIFIDYGFWGVIFFFHQIWILHHLGWNYKFSEFCQLMHSYSCWILFCYYLLISVAIVFCSIFEAREVNIEFQFVGHQFPLLVLSSSFWRLNRKTKNPPPQKNPKFKTKIRAFITRIHLLIIFRNYNCT